jgi:hypothetical protein
VVVCLVAFAATALALWYFPPKWDDPIYRQIGKTLAQEALGLLPSGGKIVVIGRDTVTYSQPAMEVSLKEFQSTAEKSGATVTFHSVQLDPLRAVEVPPGDFYEAIRRSKTNDVIVSFLGPPVLDVEQQTKLKNHRPHIIALCTGTMAEQANLSDLSARGLLHAAIINRPAIPKSSETLTFDHLYSVVRHGEFSNRLTQR